MSEEEMERGARLEVVRGGACMEGNRGMRSRAPLGARQRLTAPPAPARPLPPAVRPPAPPRCARQCLAPLRKPASPLHASTPACRCRQANV